jgi:hypothetical protein
VDVILGELSESDKCRVHRVALETALDDWKRKAEAYKPKPQAWYEKSIMLGAIGFAAGVMLGAGIVRGRR